MGETDEQSACIDKNSCQPDFLGGEETGQHEESGQEADKDSQIGHDSAFNALSGDDSHEVILYSAKASYDWQSRGRLDN